MTPKIQQTANFSHLSGQKSNNMFNNTCFIISINYNMKY